METVLRTILVLCVVAAVIGLCLLAGARISRISARETQRERSDSSTNSVSLPLNTTLYLNTREELVQFVSDLQKKGNDWQWIMITPVASLGVCFVSFVINESSEHALQVCLSRRLLMSLTPQELRYWESALQQAVQRKDVGGRSDES